MKRRGCDSVCYSYSCRIFFEEIAHICLVRSNDGFVCCKICTSYQIRIIRAKTEHEHVWLKRLRPEHVEKQRAEILCYYSHWENAIASPDHCISIIMDGMDQSKTNVPLFSRRTSDKTVCHRLVGVKVHGIGGYVYVIDETVPGEQT